MALQADYGQARREDSARHLQDHLVATSVLHSGKPQELQCFHSDLRELL